MATISSKIRVLILHRDGSKCKFCGANQEQSRLHVDHIKPRSDGGTDALDNLATLCEKCNIGKSNLYLGNYMRLIGEEKITSPRIRSALLPTKDYQVNALEQLFNYLKQSGIKQLSLIELSQIIGVPGLRDGINPIFEPISFATVNEGLQELINKGKLLSEEGEKIFKLPE